MKDNYTVETFLDCLDGKDLTESVPAKQFAEKFFGHEVDDSMLRQMFNAFHSTCPNFKEGQDDCPDCIAEAGFRP